VVVVTAAGNLGKNRETGQPQYGGITAPGNAPWVLTVGASSHQGTVDRSDDVVAPYSSRGPSAIDYTAKPDLVAPGTGTVSLSDPNSLMYTVDAAYLLSGSFNVGYKPYLSLSGTSMAAPVVAGSVALMLQANPSLTPNLVKAILQYTAQVYPGYDALTEGAGFLNTKGAVDLARYFRTAQNGQIYPHSAQWSKTIIWNNHRLHGAISPATNAWGLNVVWGTAADPTGTPVVWGVHCDDDCDNVVWGTGLLNPVCDPLVEDCDNVVWGTSNPIEPLCDPLVENCDNVVWGTNVVWATNVVWSTNVVWGTDCSGLNCANVVWGSAADDGDNVVWGTCDDGDNVVWGTSTGVVDVTMWSDADDNVTWGTAGEDSVPLYDDPDGTPACFDDYQFDSLIAPLEVPPPGGTGTEPADGSATQSAGFGGLI
jgi:serine protease AprX